MNFLCEATQQQSSVVTWVILGVLIVVMLVFPYFTQRKKNQQYMDMLSAIKVGDLVKTAGGVIGRVTKITDKGDIKTVIIETGTKNEKSTMEFDITSIYCVLKSTKAEENAEKVEAQKAEEKVEEKKEVEEKVDEKPVETKKTTKKPAAKKTSTKKSSK